MDLSQPHRIADAAASRTAFPPCVVGETLREVRVLTEAEWEALPQDRRPTPAEHVPGLGWVVAVMPGWARGR
jgi:hypothetical protein